jgi:hypothetical protein
MKLGSAFVSWRAGTIVFLVSCAERFGPEFSPLSWLILEKSAISSCSMESAVSLTNCFRSGQRFHSDMSRLISLDWRKTIVPARQAT